jgi:hypothetical protein
MVRVQVGATIMWAFLVISLLFGMLLGRCFKALVLVPAILVTLLAALATFLARGEPSWTAALTVIMSLASLQVGYLIGLAVRHWSAMFSGSRTHPFLLSASARRRAH